MENKNKTKNQKNERALNVKQREGENMKPPWYMTMRKVNGRVYVVDLNFWYVCAMYVWILLTEVNFFVSYKKPFFRIVIGKKKKNRNSSKDSTHSCTSSKSDLS